MLDLEAGGDPRLLVTGYGFLADSAARVRQRWADALDGSAVDGELIGDGWNAASLLGQARKRLRHLQPQRPRHPLCRRRARTPAGLGTAAIAASVDFAGALVYAVGCHGGLPVPDGNPADHPRDLPQTLLGRGAVGYLANSGYGWGLTAGVGLGERLIEIFGEELLGGGAAPALGEVVRASKLRYFLEQAGFDAYDQKTLLEWTHFGLPMYTVRSGRRPAPDPPASLRAAAGRGAAGREKLGAVEVERRGGGRRAAARLPGQDRPRLHPCGPRGLPEIRRPRRAGRRPRLPGGRRRLLLHLERPRRQRHRHPRLPIQPYFIYDSRLSGTSQHGALWLGGDYREEAGWKPVFATLATNGIEYSSHGVTPRLIHPMPSRTPRSPTRAPTRRASDLDASSLVGVVGEALASDSGGGIYDRQRLFDSLDLEIFYFNDHGLGGNCDRRGPAIAKPAGAAELHQVSGSLVQWRVEATDAESGVWRVVVVYDAGPAADSRGSWRSLELAPGPDGLWSGSLLVAQPGPPG